MVTFITLQFWVIGWAILWVEVLNYCIHACCVQIYEYTLIFVETLRPFSKDIKHFSSASKLIVFKAYEIYIDTIWNLPP